MAEEEEAEGEEVAETKAEISTEAKRRNLIVMTTTMMVSPASCVTSDFGLVARYLLTNIVNHIVSTLCFSSSTCSPKERTRRR